MSWLYLKKVTTTFFFSYKFNLLEKLSCIWHSVNTGVGWTRNPREQRVPGWFASGGRVAWWPESIWFLGSMKSDHCLGSAGSDLGKNCTLCLGWLQTCFVFEYEQTPFPTTCCPLGQGHLSSQSVFPYALVLLPNSSTYIQVNVSRPPPVRACVSWGKEIREPLRGPGTILFGFSGIVESEL